jgi:hypothetical protein
MVPKLDPIPAMKPTATARKVNWKSLPDPIREEEANIRLLDWTSDALERPQLLAAE